MDNAFLHYVELLNKGVFINIMGINRLIYKNIFSIIVCTYLLFVIYILLTKQL
jgi:hypothetical protein